MVLSPVLAEGQPHRVEERLGGHWLLEESTRRDGTCPATGFGVAGPCHEHYRQVRHGAPKLTGKGDAVVFPGQSDIEQGERRVPRMEKRCRLGRTGGGPDDRVASILEDGTR